MKIRTILQISNLLQKRKKDESAAVLRLLQPLVRILLRNGVSYTTFADFAKRVYVDVAGKEFAPGVAEDMSSVIAVGEAIDVPAGMFDDTLTAEDCNPLEDTESDEKVYVRGIGLAVDEEAELISY